MFSLLYTSIATATVLLISSPSSVFGRTVRAADGICRTKESSQDGGSAAGVACRFPFNYNGITYTTCVEEGDPWCAVFGDEGMWGYCTDDCTEINSATMDTGVNAEAAKGGDDSGGGGDDGGVSVVVAVCIAAIAVVVVIGVVAKRYRTQLKEKNALEKAEDEQLSEAVRSAENSPDKRESQISRPKPSQTPSDYIDERRLGTRSVAMDDNTLKKMSSHDSDTFENATTKPNEDGIDVAQLLEDDDGLDGHSVWSELAETEGAKKVAAVIVTSIPGSNRGSTITLAVNPPAYPSDKTPTKSTRSNPDNGDDWEATSSFSHSKSSDQNNNTVQADSPTNHKQGQSRMENAIKSDVSGGVPNPDDTMSSSDGSVFHEDSIAEDNMGSYASLKADPEPNKDATPIYELASTVGDYRQLHKDQDVIIPEDEQEIIIPLSADEIEKMKKDEHNRDEHNKTNLMAELTANLKRSSAQQIEPEPEHVHVQEPEPEHVHVKEPEPEHVHVQELELEQVQVQVQEPEQQEQVQEVTPDVVVEQPTPQETVTPVEPTPAPTPAPEPTHAPTGSTPGSKPGSKKKKQNRSSKRKNRPNPSSVKKAEASKNPETAQVRTDISKITNEFQRMQQIPKKPVVNQQARGELAGLPTKVNADARYIASEVAAQNDIDSYRRVNQTARGTNAGGKTAVNGNASHITQAIKGQNLTSNVRLHQPMKPTDKNTLNNDSVQFKAAAHSQNLASETNQVNNRGQEVGKKTTYGHDSREMGTLMNTQKEYGLRAKVNEQVRGENAGDKTGFGNADDVAMSKMQSNQEMYSKQFRVLSPRGEFSGQKTGFDAQSVEMMTYAKSQMNANNQKRVNVQIYGEVSRDKKADVKYHDEDQGKKDHEKIDPWKNRITDSTKNRFTNMMDSEAK